MAPYWNSLPALGTSNSKLTYPLQSLHHLQDPVLSAYITVHSTETRNIYDGGRPSIVEDFGAEFSSVTFEEFSHLASVVSNCSFPLLWPSNACNFHFDRKPHTTFSHFCSLKYILR
jgi:hypothetical protein